MMNPVIKNDFLGIFLSGEVHQVGKSVPFIEEMKIPSTPLQNKYEIQVFVSEFTLNSTVYSLYQAGYL